MSRLEAFGSIWYSHKKVSCWFDNHSESSVKPTRNFAIGHPGRTDKNEGSSIPRHRPRGHYNRKTGEYHYHSTPKSTYSAFKRGSATALSTQRTEQAVNGE